MRYHLINFAIYLFSHKKRRNISCTAREFGATEVVDCLQHGDLVTRTRTET